VFDGRRNEARGELRRVRVYLHTYPQIVEGNESRDELAVKEIMRCVDGP